MGETDKLNTHLDINVMSGSEMGLKGKSSKVRKQ